MPMSLPFLVYDIIIRVYASLIRMASPFNPKAQKWIQGRKEWYDSLKSSLPPGGADVWIHCASLGEFEQGRPVLDALRREEPERYILVTFFSPSGYEIRKNYGGANHVCYLPPDTRKNARLFTELVHPRLVIFVKYEFWFHLLTALHQRKVPVLLISAIFRPGQFFFRWYGRPFRRLLLFYCHIFAQDEKSVEQLGKAGVTRVSLTGDTRFDRVLEIAAHRRDLPAVCTFTAGKPCGIAGSTWPRDEQLIHACRHLFPKWIIAPHEVNEGRLRQLEKLFSGETVRYSEVAAHPEKSEGSSVLIIDNVGMLSALYRNASVAYIGGGFDHGIHNILEAAVYGIPVVFGPAFSKFREAVDLVAAGAAFPVKRGSELEAILQRLADDAVRTRAGATAAAYIRDKAGATPAIIRYIQENRFLTR